MLRISVLLHVPLKVFDPEAMTDADVVKGGRESEEPRQSVVLVYLQTFVAGRDAFLLGSIGLHGLRLLGECVIMTIIFFLWPSIASALMTLAIWTPSRHLELSSS